MSADELEALRHLRDGLNELLQDASGLWLRDQVSKCVAAIEAIFASTSPPALEVQRARARAKALLAVGKSARR